MNGIEMNIIAHIHTDFPEKFGIPRQSGLVTGLPARIVFEKEYRRIEAVRGLAGFSHVWLLWYFSESDRNDWSPTVRPPRLGGNTRVGVFATRSPFRPNPIGLSSVRLLGIDTDCAEAPVLIAPGEIGDEVIDAADAQLAQQLCPLLADALQIAHIIGQNHASMPLICRF